MTSRIAQDAELIISPDVGAVLTKEEVVTVIHCLTSHLAYLMTDLEKVRSELGKEAVRQAMNKVLDVKLRLQAQSENSA